MENDIESIPIIKVVSTTSRWDYTPNIAKDLIQTGQHGLPRAPKTPLNHFI
jgi:hypothetical protein